MSKKRRFGALGCGNMGAAILKGLADREDLALLGYDTAPGKAEAAAPGKVEAATSARDLVKHSDLVLLAVKPQQARGLLRELAPHLRTDQTLISICAGLTLQKLKEFCSGACPVVRVMPNTPALIGEGVFAVCEDDPSLREDDATLVRGLFEPLGKVHVLEEKYFDAFTAVAGSGPAYVFHFMEAVMEGAVTLGLSRDMATDIVKSMFLGSCRLAEEDGRHVSLLREMVSSPAGTTIEALNHLDRMAVRGAIIDAARAACRRSGELG